MYFLDRDNNKTINKTTIYLSNIDKLYKVYYSITSRKLVKEKTYYTNSFTEQNISRWYVPKFLKYIIIIITGIFSIYYQSHKISVEIKVWVSLVILDKY